MWQKRLMKNDEQLVDENFAQATLVKCVLRVAEVYRVNMSNGETMYLIPDYDNQTFQTDLNYFKLHDTEVW